MTGEPEAGGPASDRGPRVTGPFSVRQLGLVAGIVAIAALALFVATRPVGPGGSGGTTPVAEATPFLVGSPTVGLAPGDIAPELQTGGAGSATPLLDLAGKPIRLSDYRGRLVLLNFWATWCPPCQGETPVLRDLDARYRSRGLAVVAVAVQETTPADVAAYAAKYGLDYTIGFDGSADVFHAYQVFALPTQVLIGPDGRVRKVINGPLTDASGQALIEPLLPASSGAAPGGPATGASPSPAPSPSPASSG